jgi:hypothetical protein
MPETAKAISISEIGQKEKASVLRTCLVIRRTLLSQKGALAELSHRLYAALVRPLHCKSASLSLASA